MGARVKAECRDCYTQFAFDSGGGMRFYELHCDTCGNTKRIGFSKIPDIENYAGQCECGGYFKKNAKPRCPNCKSRKIKEIKVLEYYD